MARSENDSLQRLERVLAIDRLLRDGHHPNRPELARRFEVNERSISRDVDFLRDRLFAPIAYSRSKRGYYYTDPNYFLPDVNMTEGELVATVLAGTVLKGIGGSPLGAKLESVIERLSKSLPDQVKVSLRELSTQVVVEPRSTRSVDAEHFQTLQDALEKSPVWLRYYAAYRDEMSERVVEPLHLRYHLGDWYLVAFCRWRKDVRTFAVSRVHEARKESGSVKKRPDFDPERYFKSALGILSGEQAVPVRIWFAPERARWIVERTWHPSQRLERGQDGSVVLDLRVGRTAELLQWVLSYGSQARVLSPEALAEEVRREAQRMLDPPETSL